MKKWLLFWIVLTLNTQLISKEWINWLGNQFCHPAQYHEPNDLDELSACIKSAAVDGLKIRAVGGGFSLSDLVCTEGCLINLKNLYKLLSIDSEQQLVTVEAGISFGELNELLAHHGLALSNQAAIHNLTLGGAIATAVHGTGHTGTISNFVKEIHLVTSDGSIHVLSNLSDPEGFAAAKVSLGALGVIYAATLQCEPCFYLKATQQILDIETLLEKYKEFYDANDFFQFSWAVGSGKVTVDCWNRIAKSHVTTPETKICYECLNYYKIEENEKDLFSEVAVPIDALPKVLATLKPFIKKYQSQGLLIADIVVRFAEPDKRCCLSPAGGQSVAYLHVSVPAHSDLAFYREFEELMLKFQGRPHWGKLHFLDHEKALKLYGSNLEDFIRIKERLDPQDTFSNAFIDRICKRN